MDIIETAFLTAHANWPWLRQTPKGAGMWQDHRFHVNDQMIGADWLVVYDDLGGPVETDVPRENRIAVLAEPPGMKLYPAAWLDQFAVVMSPYPVSLRHGRNIVGQAGLPWFYGVSFGGAGPTQDALSLEALQALPRPAKRAALSVVCSKKSRLPKHRARLKFIEYLERQLGSRLAVYGRGFTPIDDKAEAILPYQYHLVLENNDIDNFWTEKLADSFLGWSFPIFSGCANVGSYFGDRALARIDISDAATATGRIVSLLEKGLGDQEAAALGDARRRLLDEHNLFAVLTRATPGRAAGRAPRTMLLPTKAFGTKLGRKFALWRQSHTAGRPA